jgi:hypothetical protein
MGVAALQIGVMGQQHLTDVDVLALHVHHHKQQGVSRVGGRQEATAYRPWHTGGSSRM